MITATTSIPITKPTIRPILLFGSAEKTPPFVVSSLTDAVVVTFGVDEITVVDITGVVAVVVFGSLVVVTVVVTVVVAAVVVGCDVTGNNDSVEGGDVDVSLIKCVIFSSKAVVGRTVVLVLFDGIVGEVSLVVEAVATITFSGSKSQKRVK